MDSTYTYLFKVKYWNIIEEKIVAETAIITGLKTFTEAVGELEDMYGEDLNSFEVIAYDKSIAILPEALYDSVKAGLDND